MMGMEESPKRRQFFCSPDELFDEEYYDDQMPEKKRRLTPEQVCDRSGIQDQTQYALIGCVSSCSIPFVFPSSYGIFRYCTLLFLI